MLPDPPGAAKKAPRPRFLMYALANPPSKELAAFSRLPLPLVPVTVILLKKVSASMFELSIITSAKNILKLTNRATIIIDVRSFFVSTPSSLSIVEIAIYKRIKMKKIFPRSLNVFQLPRITLYKSPPCPTCLAKSIIE